MNRKLGTVFCNCMFWNTTKNKNILPIFLSLGFWLILILMPVDAAELSLQGNWLFQLGDDSTWSAPSSNDSNWLPIRVPDYWEKQGFEDYDGFAWYRYHFQADSALLRQDSLILYLGKIDAA
ncbi:MAG: hypothetical protein KBG36_06195, partial [Candidatus Marinimicrobia bacterium]|nr:hypothetical protein [Candidatus Neomarinimicrobiota bacterium]